MGLVRELKILIRRIVRSVIAEEIHTQMPAQVVSYDGATNTCSIQPCIKRIRTTDPNNLSTIEMSQEDDIPVHFPGSGKVFLSVAPQPDSYGTYQVAEREIETWLTNGGINEPSSTRKFNISDGFFAPGLYPLKADGDNGLISPAINTDRIELRTRAGTSYISLKDDGTVELKSNNDGTITIATDGTITVQNGSGSFEIDSSGTVDINGNFTVDP